MRLVKGERVRQHRSVFKSAVRLLRRRNGQDVSGRHVGVVMVRMVRLMLVLMVLMLVEVTRCARLYSGDLLVVLSTVTVV